MTNHNQRWRQRKAMFRRPDEQIRVSEYDVEAIGIAQAREFVETHHYAGSLASSLRQFGLFHKAQLVGVASFGNSITDLTTENVFGEGTARECLELNRLVLLDEVPGNGESWFVARCLASLRGEDYTGVVSFSDPAPRTTADGKQVFIGHIGTVYQALNAKWLGRSKARILRLLPDGTVYNDRKISKIRAMSQGWRYSVDELVRFGAEPFPAGEAEVVRRAWLDRTIERFTRPFRHPGNIKYAWHLKQPKKLVSVGPYPKKGGIHAS